MKLLITGGLGFIGSHAAIYFTERGLETVVIDNLSRPGPNLKDKNGKPFNFNFFKRNYPQIRKELTDIRNYDELLRIFREFGPDFVIHAAGQTSAVDSVRDPRKDFENNVIGLFNTLEAARLTGTVKGFIFLSTNKVYGQAPHKYNIVERKTRYEPLVESDNNNGKKPIIAVDESCSLDIGPHTPYGISKLAGDQYVREYGHIYGMNTVSFRMSCIYGDRQFGFVEQGWIAHFIINILLNKTIEIFGTGKQVRDVLYIDDLLDLFHRYFTAIMHKEGLKIPEKWQTPRFERDKVKISSSEVFNIGGGPNYTISLLELISMLERLTGKKARVKFIPSPRKADQAYYVSDIRKAYEILGWKPSIPPEEGVKRTLDWLERHIDLFI